MNSRIERYDESQCIVLHHLGCQSVVQPRLGRVAVDPVDYCVFGQIGVIGMMMREVETSLAGNLRSSQT